MKHGHKFLIGALMAAALAVTLAQAAAGGQVSLAANSVIYVDANASGTNTGGSWTDAYNDLQDALNAAVAGDQIWVAAGTYKPTSGDDRAAHFRMKNGVAIYGGFAGTESNLTDRDWESHKTILSGDLNGDDGPDFANNGENSYHIFYHPEGLNLDGSAVLDGFTITGGNADYSFGDGEDGGGMYNEGSSPTVSNCTFQGNSAYSDGGGMYNVESSSPTLSNCTFSGNSAFMGGGMSNYYYSSPTLTNCVFEGNSAAHDGGGMYNWNGYNASVLTNCIFSDNSADEDGGGMYNNSWTSPTLTDCSFSGNSADRGGGVYNYNSEPTLVGCTFSGNSATYWGGGMYNYRCTIVHPTLSNCTFEGNSAPSGGGMVNRDAEATLTGCIFAANSASSSGGGMYNLEGSLATLTNCTFWGNSAVSGGGMFNSYSSSPILTNSILWADTPDEIFNYDVNSLPVIAYSDVQGGYIGDGNINKDPSFVNAANGDFHLNLGSPCVDAGNNAAPNLPDYDFEGDARILDGDGDEIAIVDMGVDEIAYGGPVVVQVDIDVKPTSKSNVINLDSRASLPVAILTTGGFDASTVDPDTVVFAGANVARSALQDVDRDGDMDRLLYFKIQQLDLDENSNEATLNGETYDGTLIEGTDRVKIR